MSHPPHEEPAHWADPTISPPASFDAPAQYESPAQYEAPAQYESPLIESTVVEPVVVPPVAFQPGVAQPPTTPYQPGSGYQTTGYQTAEYQGVPYQGVPYHPGYGPVPPYQVAPRKSRTGRIIAIVVSVVVVIALACVGGIVLAVTNAAKSAKQTAASITPGPSAATSPTASPSPSASSHTHTGDLRNFLLAAPATSRPVASPLSKNGLLTLKQDAALSSDPKARTAYLKHYHFKREAVAAWHDDDDTIVDIRLLQFSSEENAADYFSQDIADFATDFSAKNTHTVAGVPGGRTFGVPKKDKYGYVQTVSLAVRGDVVVVMFTSQLPPLSIDIANTLAAKQYEKL